MTTNAIREGLVTAFQQIKKINGYSMDLPDSNIFSLFEESGFQDPRHRAYLPRVEFILDGGSNTGLPSSRIEKTLNFECVATVRSSSPSTSSSKLAESLIDDIERMLMQNGRLGGSAQNATLTEFLLDGGGAAPEGKVYFKVSVTAQKQY